MVAFANILLGGVFHAAVLFLVAAGLQLVFGVQKILNLACGSFYALGAYAGVSAVRWALALGWPTPLFLPVLLAAGLALAAVGPVIERLLRPIYDRDESFQLLLTFALVLMFEDVIRFVWGTAPHQLGNVYLAYGQVRVGALTVPTYNLIVIACSAGIAAGMGWLLARTRFGRIVRATASSSPCSCCVRRDSSRERPRDRPRAGADRRGGPRAPAAGRRAVHDHAVAPGVRLCRRAARSESVVRVDRPAVVRPRAVH